jgi:hypothetical protein
MPRGHGSASSRRCHTKPAAAGLALDVFDGTEIQILIASPGAANSSDTFAPPPTAS